MIFSDIYNDVADQFGDTSAAMITRIKRYVNWSQQDVCSRIPEADFLYGNTTFATVNATKTYALSPTSDVVEKVIDLIHPTTKATINHVTRYELDNIDATRAATGLPYAWTEAGRSATGVIQVELYPVPNTAVSITYNYRKAPVDLVNPTDVSIIPSKYHNILYLGAVAQCYDYDQDPSSLTYWTQYNNKLEDMIKDLMSGSEDRRNALKAYGTSRKVSSLRLPPNHFTN